MKMMTFASEVVYLDYQGILMSPTTSLKITWWIAREVTQSDLKWPACS